MLDKLSHKQLALPPHQTMSAVPAQHDQNIIRFRRAASLLGAATCVCRRVSQASKPVSLGGTSPMTAGNDLQTQGFRQHPFRSTNQPTNQPINENILIKEM